MSEAATLAFRGEPLRAYNRAKLGMWLFLASEVMFFTGFIGSYIVLRMSNSEIALASQKFLNWKLAAVNTLVLICSSLTMALAVTSIQKGERGKASLFLLLTALFGCTFLGIKTVEYSQKFEHEMTLADQKQILPSNQVQYLADLEKKLADAKANGDTDTAKQAEQEIEKYTHGIYPHTNIFFASYFTLTGFHGLHVLIGVALLLYLLFRTLAGKYSAERFTPIELTGLYWHFVDIVWIFLFPILYLI